MTNRNQTEKGRIAREFLTHSPESNYKEYLRHCEDSSYETITDASFYNLRLQFQGRTGRLKGSKRESTKTVLYEHILTLKPEGSPLHVILDELNKALGLRLTRVVLADGTIEIRREHK